MTTTTETVKHGGCWHCGSKQHAILVHIGEHDLKPEHQTGAKSSGVAVCPGTCEREVRRD